MNPILKAHLEGIKKFKEQFTIGIGRKWILTPEETQEILAFLTTYAQNLLNAALEAGPERREKSFVENKGTANAHISGFYDGHNSCLSSFHSAIDEGIKEIRKGKKYEKDSSFGR